MAQLPSDPPQFAGHAVQDLANMVMVVLLSADQLSRKLDPDDPSQRDLAEIRSAAERAVALTRQLLLFAQPPPPTAVVEVEDR
jgi:signal transduction histidine kinase